MSGSHHESTEDIEAYLQRVSDTLRPFFAWESVGDGIYLLRADDEISVGKKMTKELLSHGYAVESCHNDNLRVHRIDLSEGELVFEQ